MATYGPFSPRVTGACKPGGFPALICLNVRPAVYSAVWTARFRPRARRTLRTGAGAWPTSSASHSRNGSHSTFVAERPAVIPTCPASGSTSVILGSNRASARADSGGTIRSRRGTAANAGTWMEAGSIASPATRHAPRDGRLSRYQSRKHSRAVVPDSGTPSFSQSSSATNRRAAALS